MKDWGPLVVLGLILFALSKMNSASNPTTISNNETWTWVDYKGNERQFTITRDVKAH